MINEEIIRINTVQECTELLGCPPANHPLISVCRLSELKACVPIGKPVQLNLYFIVIKDGTNCTAKYGWREYDFAKGLMSFFAPEQIHLWPEQAAQTDSWGWMMVFHPDFIRKYALGTKISKLKFFSYETSEALHISDAERAQTEALMESIDNEYKRSIDEHTQDIIMSQLDVFLNYAERFYTRQFRTRNSVEADILTRFQSILDTYFDSDRESIITPKEIAAELGMSTHYLGDLLRNLTGMNTQQHIHTYLIEKAKSLLLATNLTVNEIAFSLGFEYPQYFSRLFKSKTGQTPVEFRNMN